MKTAMGSIRVGLSWARVAAIGSTFLGVLVAGPVWADGTFPEPPHLKLTINASTASVTLGNEDALSVDVDFYEILSDTGSLVPANWTSLQSQNLPDFPAGDGSGNGWEVFGPPSSHHLAEGFFFGDSTFAPGTLLDMGLAFDPTIPNPQVVLHYAVADGAPFGIVDGTIVDGIVQYVTNPPPMPDVNGDGTVDIFDINVVSGNWSDPGSIPVPEPATAALLLIGLVSLLFACPPGRAER
jgi:hypothetical protein